MNEALLRTVKMHCPACGRSVSPRTREPRILWRSPFTYIAEMLFFHASCSTCAIGFSELKAKTLFNSKFRHYCNIPDRTIEHLPEPTASVFIPKVAPHIACRASRNDAQAKSSTEAPFELEIRSPSLGLHMNISFSGEARNATIARKLEKIAIDAQKVAVEAAQLGVCVAESGVEEKETKPAARKASTKVSATQMQTDRSL